MTGGDFVGLGVDGGEAEDVADDDAGGVGGGGASGVNVGEGVRSTRERMLFCEVRSLMASAARRVLVLAVTMRMTTRLK